ncbi:transcription elongation factor A protein 1-like [Brevipalpus obovatus]|uniref:transcription elongation factor A protein 1-like n=1 Tax=Brevipalpus obovatus TaxID=246614 RepID=UPI003D9DB543
MGHEKDVMRFGKKLDEMVTRKEFTQALDLLKALRDTPITLEILQKTRIGLAVNNIRKNCNDEEVQTQAKSLIRSWKKLLEPGKDGKSDSASSDNGRATNQPKKATSSSDKAFDAIKNSGNSSNNGSSNNSTQSKNQSQAKNNGSGSTASFERPRQSFPSNTNDGVRLKCRELLSEALKAGPSPDPQEILFDPEELAGQIEDCIYKEFKDVGMRYKNRIRSRVSNLKDSKNPDLKFNVLRGHITPARIAGMTAEEMASNEMKEMRQKFTKEAINDHQMAVTGGTKTDLIKCPKCKKTNTTYNQVQTRSADEPMTTFCFCNECGHRWKFC